MKCATGHCYFDLALSLDTFGCAALHVFNSTFTAIEKCNPETDFDHANLLFGHVHEPAKYDFAAKATSAGSYYWTTGQIANQISLADSNFHLVQFRRLAIIIEHFD